MNSCPYCGSAGDYYFNIYTRIYYRCRECYLIYKSIKEDYHQVLATYSSDDYFSRYSCDQTDRKRDKLFDYILDSIEEKKNIGRLLDVGTGCGFFLLAAGKRGWSVKGIEPSTGSTQFACEQNNLDVFNGTLQEYPENDRFDVITFINVLDHSAEPWKEIEKATALLKPGGILYLRFPNGFLHTSLYQLASKLELDDRIRKFLVFHQFSFTPKFIYKLLADSEFSEITILNSPHSEGDPHNLFLSPTFAQYVKRFLYLMAKAIKNLTQGKVLLGTSLEVLATKPKIT
jgi:2-polyprenyl-3-methyl-5-hydroxy-6-metoxy-1,4-benzoquinol methylase